MIGRNCLVASTRPSTWPLLSRSPVPCTRRLRHHRSNVRACSAAHSRSYVPEGDADPAAPAAVSTTSPAAAENVPAPADAVPSVGSHSAAVDTSSSSGSNSERHCDTASGRNSKAGTVKAAGSEVSTADGAANQQQQQRKQQQAYRQVLEQVYAAAAAPGSSSSSAGSTSKDRDSSSSLSEMLLPRLTVSPTEGQATSFQYLTQAWSEWSDTGSPILDFDQVLGQGAKPTGVQSWLLPQLLDDAQPPLFVIAPPGTGRVTAVLLAAAAELAAARAEQDQDEEGVNSLEGQEVQEGHELQAGNSSLAAATDAAEEGGIMAPIIYDSQDSAALLLANAVLPWDVEGTGDYNKESGVSDDSDQQQQQQQQQQQAREHGSAAISHSSADNAAPLCSPFLLVMLPTEAAAEAAARQHGPLLAAAGVTSCLLPPLPSEAALSAVSAAADEVSAAKQEIKRLEGLQRDEDRHLQQATAISEERAAEIEETLWTPIPTTYIVDANRIPTEYYQYESVAESGADVPQQLQEQLQQIEQQQTCNQEYLQASKKLRQQYKEQLQMLHTARRSAIAATQQQLLDTRAAAEQLSGADVLFATPQTLLQYVAVYNTYTNAVGSTVEPESDVFDINATAAADADEGADADAHSQQVELGDEAVGIGELIDLSQVFWFVADEAGMRAEVPQEAGASIDLAKQLLRAKQSTFFSHLEFVARRLPAAEKLSDDGIIAVTDVEMSSAARMVYLAEDFPVQTHPTGTGCDWSCLTAFALLKQDVPLRMLLMHCTDAAAPSSGITHRSSSSSSSSRGLPAELAADANGAAAETEVTAKSASNVACRLFPRQLDHVLDAGSLRLELSDRRTVCRALQTAEGRQAVATAFDVLRLTDWGVERSAQEQQLGSHNEFVVTADNMDLEVYKGKERKKLRDQFERECQECSLLLQKLAAARYPPLNFKDYVFKDDGVQLEHVLVFRSDNQEQPAFRPNLDPTRPKDLEFEFPEPARQLLQAQLPLLAAEQHELRQLAAEQGLPSGLLASTTELETSVAEPDSSSRSAAGAASSGPKGQLPKFKPQRKGMSYAGRQELQQYLADRRKQLAGDPKHDAIQGQRKRLPAAASREEVLRQLEEHQVLLVTGDTGCGKSTQVPQFILEAAAAQRQLHNTKIIVAQPRRLITTALAKRVAEERGEEPGKVVGYSIHADRSTSRMTRLMFCTTGVLIRRLQLDPELASVTHVIIDEVHERGLEVDFLLTAMRQLTAVRPDLKLLLMSATVDTSKLADYFSGTAQGSVGALHIDGNTFPVQQYYLEDLVEARLRAAVAAQQQKRANKDGHRSFGGNLGGLKFWDKSESDLDDLEVVDNLVTSSDGMQQQQQEDALMQLPFITTKLPEDSELASLAAAAARLTVAPLGAMIGVDNYQPGRDYSLRGRQKAALLNYQVEQQQLRDVGYSPATVTELERWRLNVAASMSTARQQHTSTAVAAITFTLDQIANPGAVLVFLPSWQSIVDVYNDLATKPGVLERCIIHVLHSSLPMSEQQTVFDHAPPGLRKLILATNIAARSHLPNDGSDDVTVVINSCRVNVASFDPVNNLSQLGPQWASKASCWQRRGRAGRVQPGLAIHLVPRVMAEQHLEPYDLPEMRRVPRVDVCLLVKSLGISDIGTFLAAAPDPPPPEPAAVDKAVRELQALGALTQQQELTSLGKLLALLPGDIKATRMVIYGALLGVLDPVLTLAAAGARDSDGTRLPNEAMMRSLSARKAVDDVAAQVDGDDDSSDDSNSGSGSGVSSGKDLQQRFAFEDARKMQKERKVELAGDHVSDHAVTLAAFKEFQDIAATVAAKARRAEAAWRSKHEYSSWSGYQGRNARPPRGKPLFKLLQEALLSERDLQAINSERLQYAQLLYRAGFLVPSEELLQKRQKRYEAALERDRAAAAAAARVASWSRSQQPEGYQWMDLLDDDLADLEPELQQLYDDLQQEQQQQQPAVTAMDWVLGEYADAAAGSHSFLTLDDEGGYIDESSAVGGWGSTPSSSSSSSVNSSTANSQNTAAAGLGSNASLYPPSEFGRQDFQELIQQYSWNVGQHPLLVEAALAAGLYPNYAFAQLGRKLEKQLAKAEKYQDFDPAKATELLAGNLTRGVKWRNAENGSCDVHPGSVLSVKLPRFRWSVFGSKRLSTESNRVFLLSSTPVPDLAVLLFSTAFNATLPSLPAAAAAALPDAQTGSAVVIGSNTGNEDDSKLSAAGAAGVEAESTAVDNTAADGLDRDQEEASPVIPEYDAQEVVSSLLKEAGWQPSASVQVLGGFAGYTFREPDDLAALMWLREHLQLLLELAVAGQSGEVLGHSRSFSSLLGQLLDLSVADVASQPDVTRLQALQQAALKAAAAEEAEKKAKQAAEDAEKRR